jgi:IS605 OrfB family transposase
LTARIRRDAVWVDRFGAFEAASRQTGLSRGEATRTVLELLGGADEYFAMPTDDSAETTQAKDFVIKAGNWLSTHWGSGAKSDRSGVADRLAVLAAVPSRALSGASGRIALERLGAVLGVAPGGESDAEELLKAIKQAVGWKGRSSKGVVALQRIVAADDVSEGLWSEIRAKLLEEADEQRRKASVRGEKIAWVDAMRRAVEQTIGMPFRTDKDHIWEYAVMLDHALRRVSAAHTWIKRAESARRNFEEDAKKINNVSAAAREWLDQYCADRSDESGGGYRIRRRAIDGWEDVVRSWSRLESPSRESRRAAVKEMQTDSDKEKFGDAQLFSGRDEDVDWPSLADEGAICVWHRDAKPDAEILKSYVAARTAEGDRARFKVPAYRHPDALRHPVFADFGNSRWSITYSALKAVQDRDKLLGKLAAAKSEKTRANVQRRLDAPLDLRGVTLGLWNGSAIDAVDFRWQGARLEKDLDFRHFLQGGPEVTRADRLGRTIAGNPDGAVRVPAVFGQKEWNGRLQAPRAELEKFAAYVEKHKLDVRRPQTWDQRAQAMWRHLGWFVTISAKLQPSGPWLDYVDAGLPQGCEYRKSRGGAFYLNYDANQGRKGHARLKLSRLPGLRILSVDLGHRYAAACAVWQTVSRKEMDAACTAGRRKLPSAGDLFISLKRPTEKLQKSGRRKGQPVEATTVYRRVGDDLLADGSPHPSPWARLDRQFLIKLQGEDRAARKPTPEELCQVNGFRQWLGLSPLVQDSAAERRLRARGQVDELMFDAVQLSRRGLRRHGDYARVAYALTAKQKPLSGGPGRVVEMDQRQRVDYLLDALVRWQELAGSTEYHDQWARGTWDAWVVAKFGGPVPVEIEAGAPRSERKTRLEESRLPLRAVAERLVEAGDAELRSLWLQRWQERDQQWKQYLRWLRKWILPRGKRKSEKTIRRVGGLGYTRLANLRGVYQTLKAFHMRPEPDDLRKNVPEPGDESLARFGRRILDALERLRENRVKQLASRIVEAALGAGTENREHWDRGRKRPRARIPSPRHAACRAVVVEDLEHYRPEQTRTRRENRGLMNWAARNVRKHLVDGCLLYGLHFEEVSPSYTSREDSRAGGPGARCADVPANEFFTLPRWTKAVADAKDRERSSSKDRPYTARHRYLRELDHKWRKEWEQMDAAARKKLPPFRIPVNGGEVFVPAKGPSPVTGGLQADLNAAANIGLRALLDPDWPGAWWYVPVSAGTHVPMPDKTAGSAAVPQSKPLGEAPSPSEGERKARNGGKVKEVVNLFSLRSSEPLPSRAWATYIEFWKTVESDVIRLLRRQAGIEGS